MMGFVRSKVLPCLLVTLFAHPALAGEGLSVVVLDVQMTDQEVDPDMQASMTTRLSAILGKTGRFQPIPQEQYSAALAAREAEAKKPCQDLQCQLQVARGLGAQAAIQTEVAPDGRGCTVTMTLLDAASTTALASSAVKNKCSPRYTMTAMDGAVVLLTHEVNSGNIKPGQQQAPAVDEADVEALKKRAEEALPK